MRVELSTTSLHQVAGCKSKQQNYNGSHQRSTVSAVVVDSTHTPTASQAQTRPTTMFEANSHHHEGWLQPAAPLHATQKLIAKHKRVKSTGSGMPDFDGNNYFTEHTTGNLSSSYPGHNENTIPTATATATGTDSSLKKELDRVHHVYADLLTSMNAEIQRCYDLLQGLGVDCEGNPLPGDELEETGGHPRLAY